METKEFKIQVPEGYEIDKENSTFERIKFKPIKKAMTYDDVARELFKDQNRYITTFSCLKSWKDVTCTSSKQTEKLIAINKLMNVAKYLNGDWKPNWNNDNEIKYFIYSHNTIGISGARIFYSDIAYFKSEELAKQAIEILGEETIKLALCTDW